MILATIQPHIGATNGEEFSINTSVKKREIYIYIYIYIYVYIYIYIHTQKEILQYFYPINWNNNALIL